MRASLAFLSIALTTALLPAFAVAQITQVPTQPSPPPANYPPSPPPPPKSPPSAAKSPPPAAKAPPPSQPPPGYQPPPPGYQQPPPAYQQPPQQPPPGYQQPPPGYQQPPPGYQQPPPGYQQPPPGYQQPPPGYQQPPPAYQPPPGYQPPPPGYQPAPGYYQQPPAGYYQQPPPGYYPSYGYAAPRPQGPPPRTHGFLALPYVGFHTFAGDSGMYYRPGATLGVLLGGRLSPNFSLNGEMRIDILNFRDVPSSETWDASEYDLGASPLFHVQFPGGEFLIGPKISYFEHQITFKDSSGFQTGRSTWHGWSTGFNTGFFFPVSRFMSLGGFFSYTWRNPTSVCSNDSSDCQSGDYAAENVFSFSFGALF
jgi:hypothetical protein